MEGKSWSESLTNVDGKSILTSAVTSMAGVGLANVVSKAVTVSKLVQAGGKVAKTLTVAGDMAADATVSVTSQLVEKRHVGGKSVLTDVMAGQASGVVGNYIKSSYQNSAKGKTLRRLADHDRRVAGNKRSESRAKRAEQSAKKAAGYGFGTAEAANTSISSGVSEAIKQLNKDDKNR